MAIFKLADRVKETTATTGSGGVYTTDGAPAGWRTFLAGVGSGNFTTYAMANGTDWETGIATVTASTLTRTTLLSSSTGSAINWGAGSKDVWLDVPAARVGETLLLPPTVAATASSVIFALDSAYTDYHIRFYGVYPSSDGANLNLQISVAAAYRTTTYVGLLQTTDSAGPAVTPLVDATTYVNIVNGLDVSSSYGASGHIWIANPANTAQRKMIEHLSHYNGDGGVRKMLQGFSYQDTDNAALDAVKIYPSAGTINGTFEIWGRRSA